MHMCAYTWGGVSIDFGGGALHYFHRFISRGGRYHSTELADTDVNVEGEGRLVSLEYTYTGLTLVPNSGGEAGFPAYRDAFQM